MLEDLLANKKKLGVCIAAGVLLIFAGIKFFYGGYKELNKNNTEDIFVEENADQNKETLNEEKSENTELKDKSIVVEIKGEVKKPDVYTMSEDSIVKDLIDCAGGVTEAADLSDINRAKKLQNHELIHIKNKNDQGAAVQADNAVSNNISQSAMININTATAEELKTLKGIGDAKAENIIQYRDKNGGFKDISDIKNVDGIGEAMFEKIKDKIEV